MSERNATIGAYYSANRNKLIKKVSGRAGTPENAEDIVQNAFVKALKYWSTDVKDIDAWFGTLLSACLKDFMKDERNYGMAMEFDEEEVAGIEMSSISDDLKQKITKEIGLASVKNRQVLTLYYCQGHTVKEVVQITDLKTKHIDLIVERFRNHMQQRYKAKL